MSNTNSLAMKRQFIEKVKSAIADWAKQYPHKTSG
jgi:hypothetical protein